MYENFQKSIDRLGITAYKVSVETGISTVTFTNWKKGRYIPKRDKMQKIADYLGVDVNYLYGNDEDKNSESIKLSLEEATAIFIEYAGNKNDVITMTISDKKEFQNYLLEQAELAYLRYQKNKGD